ncbi:hypothetical protein MIMGU_mgv1a021089mg [Erythranthe guttata]|uniref:Uncharacterized protein n=1 Tax=Erythranthe guttata TaxID=4155 RepID=A0A022RJH5_ERYGU|nr:hypothetical protein MIMGU_mgv1a021089mg [Erythranthe guttata]
MNTGSEIIVFHDFETALNRRRDLAGKFNRIISMTCSGRSFPFAMSLPEKDSLHRVGGSPFGVALLLVFLMFMIYHHSSLQERLFPLFSRR